MPGCSIDNQKIMSLFELLQLRQNFSLHIGRAVGEIGQTTGAGYQPHSFGTVHTNFLKRPHTTDHMRKIPISVLAAQDIEISQTQIRIE